MSETLENIRELNEVVPDQRITYLLKLVDLLQEQVAAQQIAVLDPDNSDCWCIQQIVDDAGASIVSQYTPQCPVHGR